MSEFNYEPPLAHDWAITIRGLRFGIREYDFGDNIPLTTIAVGATEFETDLSAFGLLAILVVGLIAAISVSASVIARYGHR